MYSDIYENMQVASEYLVMDSPESIVGVIKMSEHFKVDKKKMMECLKNGIYGSFSFTMSRI